MRFLSFFCLIVGLVACSKPNPNTLVIGTIAGPETSLVETARKVAQDKYGLTIKIVEFNDYNLPNEALADGSIDANVYQHQPYLDAAIKAHGYSLKSIGKTFVYPTGVYSQKHNSLNELPQKALIAIPNDPSNETRALQLLQKAGLIKLKPQAEFADIKDIESNPHGLRFKELDAAQLPRILPDVDAAVINTNYALPAGMIPKRDALYLESSDSPYANIIVAQTNSKKMKQLQEFVQSMQSEAVIKKASEIFGDAAIPAWKKTDGKTAGN